MSLSASNYSRTIADFIRSEQLRSEVPRDIHPPRRAWRIHDLFNDLSDTTEQAGIDRDKLKSHARWIRDNLDPLIARDGSDAIAPEAVNELLKCLGQLRKAHIPMADVKWSRIHYAVHTIAGRATRWPGKIVDEADAIIEDWTDRYGPLQHLGSPLYEQGGRLHGISEPTDLNRDLLLIKWMRMPGSQVSAGQARYSGAMGFKPGDWWINSLYAYRDGIIDNYSAQGGISYDSKAAYAVLMTETDEVSSIDATRFTYRSRSGDAGRYRLTAATLAAREPIRILRSHTLKSFWAPRAGVRYEGLYKIAGWSMVYNATMRVWVYDVEFKRLETEEPIATVLLKPIEEEMDDYKEYKRIREQVKAQQKREKQHRDTDNMTATASLCNTVSFVDVADEESPSPMTESLKRVSSSPAFQSIPDIHVALPHSVKEGRRVFRQRSVPMQAEYHEMWDLMRKQSVHDVGGFAWER